MMLKILAIELRKLNIKTNFDLMTKSELYETNYRIELNKERLPFIAETKFILVPVYGVSGTIKDTLCKSIK